MNKLKLLYDVVKTMKAKEVLNGILKAEVQKDQAKIFSIQNEFEKNLLTGQTKAKIGTELDYERKKVKHESNTEFTIPCSGESRHHEFMRHMHHHHGAKCCGIKGKLSRLAFALSVLNNLQAEEKENKTIISLNLNDLPEDMKALLHEKMAHAGECHRPGCHDFLKELGAMEKPAFVFNMSVNKNYEVEKILVTLGGSQKDDQNEQHELKATADISFTW